MMGELMLLKSLGKHGRVLSMKIICDCDMVCMLDEFISGSISGKHVSEIWMVFKLDESVMMECYMNKLLGE
jgi:hypothetical protein